MDDINISIKVLNKYTRSEEDVEKLVQKISRILAGEFQDPVQSKINVTHRSSEVKTPDAKYQIGNMYLNKKDDCYYLLVDMWDEVRDDKKYKHLSFRTSVKNNPSMLEANMGYSNNEGVVDVDGFLIKPNNWIGVKWQDDKLIDYCRGEFELEFIKTIDNDIFTDFYSKYVFND